MWVATNRQKPPEENAFAERARRKRHAHEIAAEAASAAQKAPEPSEVADSMPDLQALREAAEKANALVHAAQAPAVPFERNPESEEYVQAPDIASVQAADELSALGREIQGSPEPEKSRRGRQPSPEVQARHARVLEAVRNAEQVGIAKPAIAELLEEKEDQVYTSLRKLQGDGLVESKYLDGLGYRWLSL